MPAGEADRELKLGPGGLRDVEFAVQLLQLVHGRADESLRSPATLAALDALAAGGYVGRADAAELAAAYRFLRTRRAPAPAAPAAPHPPVPEDPADAAPARPALDGAADAADPVGRPTLDRRQWRRHAREVRRLHEKLFYRPLLDAVARLPGRGGPAHARARRGPGSRRSATPTRPARCATSRR